MDTQIWAILYFKYNYYNQLLNKQNMLFRELFGLKLVLEHSSGHGIVLPEFKIGIDTRYADMDAVFISHGHADHVTRNKKNKVYATEPTARFMALRGFKGEIKTIDFHEEIEVNGAKVTFYPAGHILGSAMIFVETENGNLLYTGDFRAPASPASEGFELPDKPVDIFIPEATFGLPIYRWEDHSHYFNEITTFAREHLDAGNTPIFLAYNLGKGQEVMMALAEKNIPCMIHESGFPLCKVYDDAGIDLGDYKRINYSETEGHALVVPSSVLGSNKLSNVKRKKVAYVSGWAAHEARRQQMIIDKRIALSDHVDFYELMRICKQLQPKFTLITHTPNPDVVQFYLEKNGLRSAPLATVDSLKEYRDREQSERQMFDES